MSGQSAARGRTISPIGWRRVPRGSASVARSTSPATAPPPSARAPARSSQPGRRPARRNAGQGTLRQDGFSFLAKAGRQFDSISLRINDK
ncbi:Exonuclease SbcC [Sphingomonas sp. T1]|nr:Exonuclease SbcC [Sphingomonas sp. T1]